METRSQVRGRGFPRITSQPTTGGLLGGVGALALVEAAGLAAGFLLQFMVARRLDPADYGRFAVVCLVELFLLLPMVGGVPHGLRHLVSVNPGNLPRALRWTVRVQLPLCATVSLALALAAPSIGQLIGDPAIAPPLRLMSVVVLLRSSVLETGLLLLNGSHRYMTQAALAVSYHGLRVACVACALCFLGGTSGAMLGLIAATVLASAAGAGVVLSLRRSVPDAADANFGTQVRAWVGLAPAYELLTLLPAASNLWLVKALVADARLVGTYAACLMIARTSSALSRAAVGGSFPTLALAFARGGAELPRAIVSGMTRVVVLLLIPALAVVVSDGAAIFRVLYGPDYRGSERLLPALFAGACGHAILTFHGGVLGAAGALRIRLWAMVSLGCASVATSAILIRLAGAEGGAWAFLLTGAGGAALMYALVRASTGPCLAWPSLVRGGVGALVMIGLGTWMTLPLIPELLIATATYAGCLLLLGEWTSEERRWLLERLRSLVPAWGPVADEGPGSATLQGVARAVRERSDEPAAGATK